MKPHSSMKCFALSVCVAGLAAAPAYAGTKYHTNLVPLVEHTTPGFSPHGSHLKINDHRHLKGQIKRVVDATGAKVTTDGTPSADDYSVEVDLAIPATGGSETVTVHFDLKKGHGEFKVDLSTDPVLSAAAAGDGVAVNAVRVKDSAGTLIGVGGFSLK